ncbi:XAC2610-related protein [Flavobacterium microcysteis]
MKTLSHLLTLAFLAIFLSCQKQSDKNSGIVVTDTLQTNPDKKEKERLAKERDIEDRDKDSIGSDNVLADALKFSVQNISKNRFYKKYEVRPHNEYTVKVEVSLDNHFTKLDSHLIIRRIGPDGTYIDIYSKNGTSFKKVLAHQQWTLEYVNDTIRDINGDGLNDFVVNWYGSSGCCLKGFSNVYLLRSDKKTFSNDFEFINPTFSPKEKIVRGVCYGHPGQTEMYKYKWRGETIDTLEYISYEKNKKDEKTGKIIITKGQPYKDNLTLKRLDSVPGEYKKIESYDWFTGNM